MVLGDPEHVLEVFIIVFVEISVYLSLAGLVNLRGGFPNSEFYIVLDARALQVLHVEYELHEVRERR